MTKVLKNPLIIIIITIITIVFYISLSKTQQKTFSTDQNIESSQKKKQQLEVEKEILEQKLQTTNSEETIRNEFLMQKDGEYVVKVPSLPEENKTNNEKNKESNLDKWKKLLF